MDYKEKYETAFAEARRLREKYDDGAIVTIKGLEQIFPELRESEDEKIRKELIEFIRTLPCTIHVKEEYFAWLEKQKPIIARFRVGDVITSLKNNNLKYLIKEVGIKNELGTYDYVVEDVSDTSYKGRTHKMSIEKVDNWGVSIDWIKDYGTQPKQEWSKEDETGWTNTMIMIKECATNHYTKDSTDLVINWLKSLKERCLPQPKQEWSKEDDEYFLIQDAISGLQIAEDKLSEEGCTHLLESIKKSELWLKSLKPRWKPSEEQMHELEKAIIYVESCHSNFKGSGAVLENLYEQLQKL